MLLSSSNYAVSSRAFFWRGESERHLFCDMHANIFIIKHVGGNRLWVLPCSTKDYESVVQNKSGSFICWCMGVGHAAKGNLFNVIPIASVLFTVVG